MLLLLVTVSATAALLPCTYRMLLFPCGHSITVTADASECLGTQQSRDDTDTWSELPTMEAGLAWTAGCLHAGATRQSTAMGNPKVASRLASQDASRGVLPMVRGSLFGLPDCCPVSCVNNACLKQHCNSPSPASMHHQGVMKGCAQAHTECDEVTHQQER